MHAIKSVAFLSLFDYNVQESGNVMVRVFYEFVPSSIHPLLVVRSVYPGKKPLCKYTRYRVQIVLNLF